MGNRVGSQSDMVSTAQRLHAGAASLVCGSSGVVLEGLGWAVQPFLLRSEGLLQLRAPRETAPSAGACHGGAGGMGEWWWWHGRCHCGPEQGLAVRAVSR